MAKRDRLETGTAAPDSMSLSEFENTRPQRYLVLVTQGRNDGLLPRGLSYSRMFNCCQKRKRNFWYDQWLSNRESTSEIQTARTSDEVKRFVEAGGHTFDIEAAKAALTKLKKSCTEYQRLLTIAAW